MITIRAFIFTSIIVLVAIALIISTYLAYITLISMFVIGLFFVIRKTLKLRSKR